MQPGGALAMAVQRSAAPQRCARDWACLVAAIFATQPTGARDGVSRIGATYNRRKHAPGVCGKVDCREVQENETLVLDTVKKMDIAKDLAMGLAYLHAQKGKTA
eukprot:1152569-Pelagomonas_calceolata.AAC.2